MPYVCDTLIYDPRVIRATLSCEPMSYDTKFQHDHSSYSLFSLFEHVYITVRLNFFIENKHIIAYNLKKFNKIHQDTITVHIIL